MSSFNPFNQSPEKNDVNQDSSFDLDFTEEHLKTRLSGIHVKVKIQMLFFKDQPDLLLIKDILEKSIISELKLQHCEMCEILLTKNAIETTMQLPANLSIAQIITLIEKRLQINANLSNVEVPIFADYAVRSLAMWE